MKDYVFNERKSVEKMISNGFVDQNNPTYTIYKLARYNHYVLGMNKQQNYDSINGYMKKNCETYTEIGYYRDISGCIKNVNKVQWKEIQAVVITAAELERISSLCDDRKEKIAFVLLADAKYDGACKGAECDVSFLSNSDLYKFARVTMPIKDRNMFLGFLYDENLVEENLNPKFTGKKLLYLDYDSEPELVLTENNYKELAFSYMNWKYGGYKECCNCGRLFKPKRNAQYCKSCTKKNNTPRDRFIKCIEEGCEEIVEIDKFDNETCRCEKHRKEHLRELKRLEMQRYRAKKKNV